ncbi:hypothetical protein PV325_013408 [Microctonus aethiopoides]|nr:hypothetical protein PV325_013408 [Microctonus aethiopoides]
MWPRVENYLIFEKSSTLNPCQTSSITNHTSYELILEWEKDVDGVFTVDPESLRISSGKSGHFRISFKPQSDRGKCYVRDIALYGSTIKSLSIEHAFTLIRLMGYWSPNKIEWIENKKIITLPPCTSGSSSYTTFLIINDTDDDPLTFQLIPPYPDSVPKQFNVKPMLGIIYKKYQIVAVEMFPDAISEHFYNERWSIKFNVNSDEQSFVHVEFQGLAEFPNIRIGNNDIYNEINFSSVHPGCKTIQSVSMKNLTGHSIRYEFSYLPSYISLDNLTGVLCNHEIQSFDWAFSSLLPKQYECNILCSITTLEEYTSMKKPVEIVVRISAMSAIGSLKAEPDEINFTEIPYNELRKFNFHLFNVSEVEMCFKLISKPATGEACCDEISKFEMHPIFGHILPTERQEIIVSLVPCKVGFFKFLIMYAANESQNSITICTINYTCTLPIIKINSNFGKLTLWRLLKINLLNKIIAEMDSNTIKKIDIYIPQITANNNASIVKLLVKNVSSVPAYWRLKKNLMASNKKNLNEISNVIHPKCDKMQPNDEIMVKIKLNEAIHCEQCQWHISLGQNRQIILAVNHSSRTLYGPNFILGDVYLGDLYPKYQAFWLYNPTSHDLIFSIDIEVFDLINAHHRAVALTCVKPIGSIPTQMFCPILVKFQPRRSDSFTILIPIIVGETETSLMMEGGTSLIHQQMKIPRELPQLPKTFYIPEVSVYINSDIIILSDIPLCSHVICPIILSNGSDDEVYLDMNGRIIK